MFIYILFVTIIILAALCNLNSRQFDNKVLLSIIFLFFVVLVSFTDGNGLDWYGENNLDGYALINYRSLGFENLKRFEPGFVLLNMILGDFHRFLFVMAVGAFIMVWKTINKECEYKYIGVFVYLATMTLYFYMGIYRQAIAQTILIYSWQYRYNRKIFLLLILLACMFHYSAGIALLYLTIPKENVLPIKYCCVLLLLALGIRPFILPLLLSLSMYLPGETSGKIGFYVNGDDFGTSISYSLLLLKLLIYGGAYIALEKRKKSCFFLNMFGLSIIIYLILSFSPTFGRLTYFFSCSEIILVPLTIDGMFKKIKSYARSKIIPVLYTLLVICLYTYSYFSMLDKFSNVYIPYKSILHL